MSEIKVNKISPKQTCTQLTLGDSGDTIIIPAGATITNNGTATGFGRTGTVNWDTTKKTTGFTAVNGVGYFCDTSSAAFTVTLPAAPSAGDIVALSDYTGTWATNNLTIGRNSSNINGAAADLIFNVNNTTATLIYVDATEGWRVIDTGSLSELNSAQYIVATGGTVLTCGDYKTHVFTGPGTFTVCSVGNPLGSNSVEYLVVAGGGAGGFTNAPASFGGAGGGGAGGYRQNYPSPTTAGLPVTAQGYPITVGGGGPAANPSSSGNNSVFSTITSTGGGKGGDNPHPSTTAAAPGGSGGGGLTNNLTGGSGNSPPTSPPQGNNGGNGTPGGYGGGGGGGGAAVGTPGTCFGGFPGAGTGGAGSPIATAFFGPTSPSYGTPGPAPGRYFAGGGGGGTWGNTPSPPGTGGLGGAGGGGNGAGDITNAQAGTTNTGGGGGGGSSTPVNANGAGGSGIVVIRYKFQ